MFNSNRIIFSFLLAFSTTYLIQSRDFRVTMDGKEVLNITEFERKILENKIPKEIFDADMKRRIFYFITHPYRVEINKLKRTWIPKLKQAEVKTVPLADEDFAHFLFSHPVYKSTGKKVPSNLSDIAFTIKVNGKKLFSVNNLQKEVICQSISKGNCENFLIEKIAKVISENIATELDRLKKEWEPKLRLEGVKEIPIDDMEFAKLILSRKDYKDRSQRIKESPYKDIKDYISSANKQLEQIKNW